MLHESGSIFSIEYENIIYVVYICEAAAKTKVEMHY